MDDLINPFSDIRSEIIKRRKKAAIHEEDKKSFISLLQTAIFFAIIIMAFLLFFGFEVVDGNGMFPSLSDGDLVVTYRKSEYRKNDVVFYNQENIVYSGRVVAKGGDVVDISEAGEVTVNGAVQKGEIIYPTFPPDGWSGPLTVPDNSLFILGDYRTQTLDSRNFGMISIDNVKAKAIFLLRHRGI